MCMLAMKSALRGARLILIKKVAYWGCWGALINSRLMPSLSDEDEYR
jgi:hypothetical protein